MAQTEYVIRARSKTGRLIESTIRASSESEALSIIRQQGGTPIAVEPAKTGLNREITLRKGKVTKKDLAIMARQTATMLSSGLQILRCLTILSDQTTNPAMRDVLLDVRQEVEQGLSVSDAMALHQEFPPLMVSMVRAGEVGGFLDGSMLQIAELYEDDVRLRGKIKAALTYPIAVGIIAIIIVTGMLLFVVPVFAELFSSLGGSLPLPTQILVFFSDLLKNPFFLVPFLAIIITAVVVFRRVKDRPEVREVIDPLKFKVPVFGPLARKIALARFSRNFAALLKSGVPILTTLDIVGDTAGNIVISRAIDDVKDSVRQGTGMAARFAQHPVFPVMVVQMIAVGEDTGEMDTMLGKVADFYEQEADATADQLTSLIEPIMLVALGLVVGAMVIALYLPIFSVFELVSG